MEKFIKKTDFAVGVLVYNPYDDVAHIERVQKAISSLIRSAVNSQLDVNILVLLNNSKTPDCKTAGVGVKTKATVYNLVKQFECCRIDEISYEDSMNVKGYVSLMKSLGLWLDYKYLTIFADDYIVPIDWFDTVWAEFKVNKNIDFILPSTCFVAQQNLIFPTKIGKKWVKNTAFDALVGIDSGVTFEDVDKISKVAKYFPSIPYFPPCTFETAVFKREVIDTVGYPCEEYYSILYNTDYFECILSLNYYGVISRKSFVFHHGKGATRVVFKNGDEKYSGSPVECRLISDINLYNARRGKSLKQWWSDSSKKPVYIGKRNVLYEFAILLKYYLRKYFR